MSTYPEPPTEFPSAFNGIHNERMLHPRIAVWFPGRSDYQIYQVDRTDWPAIRLNPTNTDRTSPFYFASDVADHQSRTFTLYKPRARIHSHIDLAIWHTGGWLCRKQGTRLDPVIPILGVSDPAKLQFVGNVNLHRDCDDFREWEQFQTPHYWRPIIHNRILTGPSLRWEDEEAEPPAVEAEPVPRFVAEALLDRAVAAEECCPISLEPLKRGGGCAVTSCFHIFQHDSIAFWKKENRGCPVCKKAFAITEV